MGEVIGRRIRPEVEAALWECHFSRVPPLALMIHRFLDPGAAPEAAPDDEADADPDADPEAAQDAAVRDLILARMGAAPDG